MNTQSFMRHWLPGLALLCLWIDPAAGGAPNGKFNTCQVPDIAADNYSDDATDTPEKAPATCDDSDPATDDKCVAGACVNEPVVACPCADEYAAAVAAYDARPGALLTAWLGCDESIAGTGGRIAYATKEDPDPTGKHMDWVTVILVAKGRWGYGRGITRLCEAWTYRGLAGDFARPPLDPYRSAPGPAGPQFVYSRHAHLSAAEISACAELIQATRNCP